MKCATKCIINDFLVVKLRDFKWLQVNEKNPSYFELLLSTVITKSQLNLDYMLYFSAKS